MHILTTFWQFTRPHTIIGSALSIGALYCIAGRHGGIGEGFFPVFVPSLLSALACNVYITGLNQWSDVDVDRINKPHLPIPAGKLSSDNALRIVIIAGVIALATAAALSLGFLLLIALIAGIGTAYSLPPLKFKRHHLLAAGAITVVRGLLVNLGFYAHFRHLLYGNGHLDTVIWPLTFFVVFFSLGIAWFKDIPDTEGDEAYHFGTLAVRWGRRPALLAGVLAVMVAYGIVISATGWNFLPNSGFYSLSHGILLLIFAVRAIRLDTADNKAVKRFYLFFWGLFFLEYILYPIGFYL